MTIFKDIANQRFGQLVAIKPLGSNHAGQKIWECLCDCGTICAVLGFKLRQGQKSCGCQAGYTHGHTKHPLYHIWKKMRQRCRDPHEPAFKYYGGRGISVCESWNDFTVFLNDVGERPPGTWIDRINNDGNYEPGNIRWSTPKQQRNNQTRRPARY